MTRKSNQLQNHPKFITVHEIWTTGTPHNQRTMDHGIGGGGYFRASSNESTGSPLLFQNFSEPSTSLSSL